MATQLKHLYNKEFYSGFLKQLKKVVIVNEGNFLNELFTSNWESLELKQRMRHTTRVLANYLSSDFPLATEQLISLIGYIEDDHQGKALEYLFLPDFVELYGQNYWEQSMTCLQRITQYSSAEFAIRPFIISQPERTMRQMVVWSKHEHPAVRRQASEGCRPRLPWAMTLPELKKDPSPILPILENLKADNSEYVRKSVANNLNDISKDHPELVLKIAQRWQGSDARTDWIIKHGCRTLLKAGNTRAMRLFGFEDVEAIVLEGLEIHNPKVVVGGQLDFSFKLRNKNKRASLLRLEYAIYYQKANGTLTPKVYKISEKEYRGGLVAEISKSQSFKPISTRKFHTGLHQLAIIVNGVEKDRTDFELVC